MDDCGVVASAEGLSDLDQLQSENLSGQIHGHLARGGEDLGASLGLQSINRDPPFCRHPLLHRAHTIMAGGARRSSII